MHRTLAGSLALGLTGLHAIAGIVVTNQTGELKVTGTGGTQQLSAPSNEQWNQALSLGGGPGEWRSSASARTGWDDETLSISIAGDIGPGDSRPALFTSAIARGTIDFQITQRGDYHIAFFFGVSAASVPPLPDDLGIVQASVVNLATGEAVQTSADYGAFTSLEAGNYRLVFAMDLNNDEEAPQVFKFFGRTISGGLSLVIPPCSADFNADGFVNGDDFDEFVSAFVIGDPAADFDADGFVTGDDYDAFVNDFEAGC